MDIIKKIRDIILPIRQELEEKMSLLLLDDANRITARGECDQWSPKVTKALNDNGLLAETVFGWYHDTTKENWCEHFWTELDGLIVDITADQFGEFLPSIVIGRNLPQYFKGE
jgi:hypothetical protein